VSVTNTGDRAGETVVQLYARVRHAHFVRAEKSLIAWKRVSLAPGEQKTVELPVSADMLRLYDHNGDAFPLAGTCKLMFGLNCEDITAETSVNLQ
jgi:beta-glucosidase